MKFLKNFTGIVVTAAVFILLFVACLYYGLRAKAFYMDTPGTTSSGSIDFSKISMDQIVEKYVNEEMDRVITIAGAGDMKFYEWQLKRAYDETTESFDFTSSFQYISKYLDAQDYTIGDLETTMAGSGKGASSDIYGYGADRYSMNFNTPEVLATNLAAVGFDMMVTANEHALDSNQEGLNSTINYLNNAGIAPIGTRKDSQDSSYVIQTIKGMKTGFIAYTNVMNGMPEESALSLVNYLNGYSEENITQMCQQIQEMKSEGAEAVLVMLHFGTEMSSNLEEADVNLARRIVEAGADVIFGCHSGVPEPIEIMTVNDSDDTTRKAVIIYSMGNFLTSQQYVAGSGVNRDMGMMCEVEFIKTKDDVHMSSLNVIPVYSNWTLDAISTIPLIEAYEATDSFGDIFNNEYKGRISDAYESIFPALLQNSSLQYTIEDYKYKISLEN